MRCLTGLKEWMMKVLVACEFSGTVRDAFTALGHEAISCDILPTAADGWHCQGDVFDIIHYPFDLMIAHPPCTHLSVSGARHFAEKRADGRQHTGASFFMRLVRESAHIPMSRPSSRRAWIETLMDRLGVE